MDWVRGQAYSQDLRSRVLAASDRGLSAREVSAVFEVSVSYVLRARQRRARTGEVRALKSRQVQVRRLAVHGDALREKIASRTDLTLAELCTWLRTDRAVSVGTTALWRELRRLGLTLKKSRSTRPSRTGLTWLPRAQPGETHSPG
jgi:transposase